MIWLFDEAYRDDTTNDLFDTIQLFKKKKEKDESIRVNKTSKTNAQ